MTARQNFALFLQIIVRLTVLFAWIKLMVDFSSAYIDGRPTLLVSFYIPASLYISCRVDTSSIIKQTIAIYNIYKRNG